MKLFFILIFFVLDARADMNVWSDGLHLYAGGGANTSLYSSRGDTLGEGLHFKTDFGHSFKKAWAIEAGSFVKFTKVHETLVWDTLLTIGVRRKLPDDYFIKPFMGQAPTVFYTRKTPAIYRRTNSSRILYTGPAFGVTVGKILKTYFWEITASYQTLDKGRGIRDEKSVPTEVFRLDQSGIKIMSLSITFGLQVF